MRVLDLAPASAGKVGSKRIAFATVILKERGYTMETRNPAIPQENAKAMNSMTAFSVFLGYWRFIQAHPALVDEKERAIVNKIIPEIKKGFPWFGPNGFLLNSLYASPLSVQSYALSKAVPGYDAILGLRKLMIRQWLNDQKAEQVVVLGDGFDTRALIYGLMHEDVQVYACDRGPTRKLKLEALQALREHYDSSEMKDDVFHINHNIHYVSLDLASVDLATCLKAQGFSSDKKTAVLLEGVLSYLNNADIARLMQSIVSLDENNEGNIHVLLSVMDKIKYNTDAQKRAHQNSNESLKSFLPPADTIAYFGHMQLEVTGRFSAYEHFDLVGEYDLHEHYVLDAEKPEAESISRELYYVLKPSSMVDLNRSLQEVPVLPLTIEEAPAPRASWCNVL